MDINFGEGGGGGLQGKLEMHLVYIISKHYMTCVNGLAFDQRFTVTTDEPNSKSAGIPAPTSTILKGPRLQGHLYTVT